MRRLAAVLFPGPWAFLVILILSSRSAVFAEEPPIAQVMGRPPGPMDRLRGLTSLLGISGSVRGGYLSSSRTLDEREDLGTASLWLRGAPRLGSGAALVIEGWILGEDFSHENEIKGALRETYLDVGFGSVDLRIGKQIVVWGRADRINPTDNLTPRDFTLLFPEEDDQRIGTAAVKATYYLGSLSLTGIWPLDFEPHTVPIPPLPPPLTLHEAEPERPFRQGAIKVEQTGKAVDWSLSYLNGFDLFPDLGIDRSRPPVVNLRHHRIRVIGADAATVLGRYGLRGEAAYTFTEDGDGEDPFVKNPFFFLVLGGERTFLEYLNVNLQYLLRVMARFHDPQETSDPLQQGVAIQQAVINNQTDRIQQGVSVRFSHQWFNETLRGEVVAVFSTPRHDYAIRPKVTYALSDRWKAIVGGDLFRGPERSFFGFLRKNSTAYAELRYGF